MKKIVALLLSLLMLLPCLPALAEEAEPLTLDELTAFCDELLKEALSRGPVPGQETEEGDFIFDYGDFALFAGEKALTESTAVTAAEVRAYGDMRGISSGSSLETLLSAYPLDNENLRGSREEATLYISGILPETVNAAHALRDGSRGLVLQHTVYETEGEIAEISSVVYTLEANCVVAVRIQPAQEQVSLEEAQRRIDELARVQEEDDYTMYREAAPEPLSREDLTFDTVDFVSGTAEDLLALLGPAQSDSWEQDGAEYLRVMQWEGVQAIFQYDAQRRNPTLQLIQVYGDQLEGPRGLRVEDTMDSVMARFPRENELGVLYGDGEHAPYGRCDLRDDGAYLVYVADVEGAPVLLGVTVIYDRVADITLTY